MNIIHNSTMARITYQHQNTPEMDEHGEITISDVAMCNLKKTR